MSQLPSESPAPAGRARAALRLLARTFCSALGAPDYRAYLAHRREHHPGAPVMTGAEFFAQRQAAKYGRGASRCC